MPAVSDHNSRDAQAAAYAEIQLELGKHRRRLLEDAKARIATEIARRTGTGEPIDGTVLGREAATAALNDYLGPDTTDAIEATASAQAELDAAADA